jgi:opacity protein-like surface antigen
MRRKFFLFLAAATILIFAAVGSAAESETGPPVYVHDYKPEALSQPPGPFVSLRLHAGSFDTSKNPGKLEGEGGGFTSGIELGFVPKRTISYHMEFMSTSRRYNTPATVTPPAFGSISDRMTLDTTALLLGVRAAYPSDRVYRVHATGGIGYFKNTLSASASVFGIPGEISDEDSSFGFHAGVGFEAAFDNWVVGVDYRRWFIDGSFSSFGISNADIGGNYLGLSVGWYF